jgi:hypothetical protein
MTTLSWSCGGGENTGTSIKSQEGNARDDKGTRPSSPSFSFLQPPSPFLKHPPPDTATPTTTTDHVKKLNGMSRRATARDHGVAADNLDGLLMDQLHGVERLGLGMEPKRGGGCGVCE